jgi:negative regulator of sigma E activity
MISNETLSAFLDGELPVEEMESVRRAVARDELLAARLRQFDRVDKLLAAFCADIDKQPLPDSVMTLLDKTGHGNPATNATTPRETAHGARASHHWPRMLALAASVVLAILIGVRFDFGKEPVVNVDQLASVGPIAPSSPLHRVLENSPSDETVAVAGVDGLSITPVLSFESINREYCREFRVNSAAQASRAVACRLGDRWQTLQVAAIEPGIGMNGSYETAAAASDAHFDAFVDAMLATTLDAEDEARLRAQHWRKAAP